MNRTAVEQIKERIPIDDLIGSYVKLEKSGKSFKARCPFHNEKSASFFVSPDRGGYYCFGCGAKGDIFSFVQQFEGLDFRGALKILAEKAGVQLTVDRKADGERDQLFEAMELATAYFEKQLENSAEAREYVKGRGITDMTRDTFRIGWAPEGWSNLHTYLKGKGFSDFILERAGLIKKRDGGDTTSALSAGEDDLSTFASSKTKRDASEPRGQGNNSPEPKSTPTYSRSDYYDRFRGRVTFPLCDSGGRVIAFSGRILKDDGKSAKYLNSPDTPLFDKSQVLYGLDKAKLEIRRLNYAILVEGQMDLVMSHQAGIRNTVASSGTALSDETLLENGAISNLGLVRRLSPNIIVAFDSDSAGRKAALRAAGIALSIGMDVKIADLVGGKDPADLVLHDPEDWKDALRKAKPVIEFELDNVIRDTPDPKKLPRALQERVYPLLLRIPSRSDLAHFVKMIQDRANFSKEDVIWEDIRVLSDRMHKEQASTADQSSSQNKTTQSGTASRTSAEIPNRTDLVERRLFGLLLLMEKETFPSAQTYRDSIQKISGDSYDERIARIKPSESDILFEAEAMFGADSSKWDTHMKELVFNFETDLINEELIVSMNKLKVAEKAGDMATVAELAKKCQVLSMRKASLRNH